MNVVPAGVHHVHFHAEIVGCANGAGVGYAGEFLQGQGIEISADENSWACSVLQDSNDAVTSDAGRYFNAQRLELLGQARRSFLLAEREFRMRVAMVGGQNPGPGVVKRGMSVNDIEHQLQTNLDELETADGVNNHMGSLGTQDVRLLEPMMQVIKQRQLFFLDSRTSAKSKAINVARTIGVSSVERDVFLDNDQDREAILQALQEGVKIAEKRGYAVMIGHAWSAELAQVLIDTYPHLVEQGYDFDSLVNYFLGGKGFVEGSARAQTGEGTDE